VIETPPGCVEWADKAVYSDDASEWVWVSTHVDRLQHVVLIEALIIVVLLWCIGALLKNRGT
jgi:hypothetical protein